MQLLALFLCLRCFTARVLFTLCLHSIDSILQLPVAGPYLEYIFCDIVEEFSVAGLQQPHKDVVDHFFTGDCF